MYVVNRNYPLNIVRCQMNEKRKIAIHSALQYKTNIWVLSNDPDVCFSPSPIASPSYLIA